MMDIFVDQSQCLCSDFELLASSTAIDSKWEAHHLLYSDESSMTSLIFRPEVVMSLLSSSTLEKYFCLDLLKHALAVHTSANIPEVCALEIFPTFQRAWFSKRSEEFRMLLWTYF